VKIARSGRPILALDGCALECTASSLAERGVQPAVHLLLSEQGVKKRYASDFDAAEAEQVFQHARAEARTLQQTMPRAPSPDAVH
jgi:uncharacterized metal-binding protein